MSCIKRIIPTRNRLAARSVLKLPMRAFAGGDEVLRGVRDSVVGESFLGRRMFSAGNPSELEYGIAVDGRVIQEGGRWALIIV